MKIRTYILVLLVTLAIAGSAFAQSSPLATQTVLVLPFENASKAPGLDWISEAFPEILGQRLASPGIYVIGRDDRMYAFDRLGIPLSVKPSRATLYRIAEQMDADFVVLGDYRFDGQTFSAQAQVLDMKKLRLSPELNSSGPLVNLIEIQGALAWEVLRTIRPQTMVSKEQFVRAGTPVRLDAFENYIRGILATSRTEKIRRYREAVRLNPQYTLAMLQLGRTYYANREYESASSWLSRIPGSDPAAAEAGYLLGLSYYYLGQFDKAETAFKQTEARVPLTEVYNNLGVVSLRRGKREASQYFTRAVSADPNDPDYHFNLALALYRNGDTAGAVLALKESVAKHPTDVEAKQFLDSISAETTAAAQLRTPLPRLKRNYDETSYKQLALEVQNAMEQSLANADPKKHAAFHVERGLQLLGSGMIPDAEKEFREAVTRDPANADAHAGLAAVAEQNNDMNTARAEARTALQLKPSASAYLVLARVELKANNYVAATQNADQALWLEPGNSTAMALKREIADKQTRPEPAASNATAGSPPPND